MTSALVSKVLALESSGNLELTDMSGLGGSSPTAGEASII
jgi:hypothetical protein